MYKKIIFAVVIGFFSIMISSTNAQAACNVSTLKTVKFGQKSAAVSNMQACLIQRKYTIAGGATGLYGSKTVLAVKKFYADNKIKVDGKTFGPSGINIMKKKVKPTPAVTPVVTPAPTSVTPTPIPVPAEPQSGFTCGKDLSYENGIYRTAKVGNSCWLKDNLNVGEMIQGKSLPQKAGTVEKYCYGNDEANCAKLGGLYTWEEAMGGATNEKAKGICPAGWHIPSLAEWGSLYEEAGVSPESANTKTAMYIDPSGNTLDRLLKSIDIVLNGFKFTNGLFYNKTTQIFFWTSDQATEGRAFAKYLINEPYNITIGGDSADTKYGMSVRCVKSN